MSTPTLELDGGGLRVRLDEPQWADVAGATGLDLAASALRPLVDADPEGAAGATGVDPGPADPAVVEAARLALGPAPVSVSLVTGAGDRGVLATMGADPVSLGLATRVLVAAADGSGPQGVPGVELTASLAGQAVSELMRLFPAGGGERHVAADPVVLPADQSMVIARAVEQGDVALARRAARACGFDDVPELLTSIAHGSLASARLTVQVAGRPDQQLRQWLLADVGWVSLGLRGRDAVHVARSREEVRAELVDLLAGAFDAAAEGAR